MSVVVAGHICLDVIPDLSNVEQLPAPGQLTRVGASVFSPGGPVSNTGLALHLLGVDTRLMGKVGDDAFGQIILDLVRARDPHLANGIIIAPGEISSYSIVLNLPRRDRAFLHCSGANDTFRAADLNLGAVADADLFHFGYPPIMAQMYANDGAELAQIFRSVQALGITTSLDLCMVALNSPAAHADWHTILRATLPYVDLFMPSIEEMLLLLWRDEYERLGAQGSIVDALTPADLHRVADNALNWGAKIVGLKLGHRGLYLKTASADKLRALGRVKVASVDAWADREMWSPVFQVDHFVGAAGSGDATIAGFIAALLRGKSPEETLTFACAVGGCNVEAADTVSGIQDWDATWRRVAAGWKRVPLELNDPAWQLDEGKGVWSIQIE